MQKLHFKIGLGINTLIRDIYWFEDNQTKAMNILETFIGITLTQCMDLLNGDAEFVPNDDGTVNLVYKEDKEFKKKLQEHKEFIKNREKEKQLEEIERLKNLRDDLVEMRIEQNTGLKKASGTSKPCEYDCQYNMNDTCCYGGWNCGWGCYLDNPDRNEILSEKMLTENKRAWAGDRKFHGMSNENIGSALLDEFLNDNLEDDVVVHKKKIVGPHGWLAPDGTYYQVSLFQHGATAKDIVDMIGKQNPVGEDHQHFLERLGFIIMSKGRLRMTGEKKATRKQIDKLDTFFKNTERIIINNRGFKDVTKGLFMTCESPHGTSGGDFKVTPEEIMGIDK